LTKKKKAPPGTHSFFSLGERTITFWPRGAMFASVESQGGWARWGEREGLKKAKRLEDQWKNKKKILRQGGEVGGSVLGEGRLPRGFPGM